MNWFLQYLSNYIIQLHYARNSQLGVHFFFFFLLYPKTFLRGQKQQLLHLTEFYFNSASNSLGFAAQIQAISTTSSILLILTQDTAMT